MSNYEYQSNGNYGNPYTQNIPPEKPKKGSGFAGKMGKAVAIGLAFGLAAGATFNGTNYIAGRAFGEPQSVEETSEKTEKAEEKTATQVSKNSGGVIDNTAVSTATTVNDVSDIVNNVMPAVVQVTSVSVNEYRNWFGQVGLYESEGAGSGVIIAQDDEYINIATNNHVVSGAKQLTVTFCDDSAVEGELLGTDVNSDLAVVRVKVADLSSDTISKIRVATLGSSEDVKVGESAIVIGNALGYGQSVTTGVISALSREVELRAEDGTIISNKLIQTDAAVNPGNSGGAILNMKGEVIGIVSAKYSDTDVEGMGYAIPISEANTILGKLISGEPVADGQPAGNGAYLGVAGVDIDGLTAQQYHMPTGVYISRVINGSGAEEAGIQKGDIIVAFNGKDISSMSDLQNQIGKLNPGDSVEITVARENNNGYDEITLSATLSEVIQ